MSIMSERVSDAGVTVRAVATLGNLTFPECSGKNAARNGAATTTIPKYQNELLRPSLPYSAVKEQYTLPHTILIDKGERER